MTGSPTPVIFDDQSWQPLSGPRSFLLCQRGGMNDLVSRVAARYASEVVASSQVTTKLLTPLADAIDAMERAGKRAEKAMGPLAKHVGEVLKGDDFQARVKGLNAYAPEQQVEDLTRSLNEAMEAVKGLARQYDDAIGVFSRLDV